MPAAITVENLSKAYRIGQEEEIPDTLLGAATAIARSPLKNYRRLRSLNTSNEDGESEDTLWALKDVSFEVQEGEVLGVIGRNGAGKSTLLKILSRITKPTTGRATIRGRVSSLLEVGTGFHPELTGRDNVYMNGTILGMTKREIDRKFDEIVDFSGVEKFLDTPIKRYSSGMKVRLAFAVAAHLEPEILIIDEVLAVGDAEFQKKCLGKMQDVAVGGRTVLFVSHNMAAVESLCSRVMLLMQGGIALKGSCDEVLPEYLRTLRSDDADLPIGARTYDRRGTGEVRWSAARLIAETGPTLSIPMDSDVTFELSYVANGTQQNCNFGFHIRNYLGQVVYRVTTLDLYGESPQVQGCGTVRCHIPRLNLLPGTYQVALFVKRGDDPGLLDHLQTALEFAVLAADVNGTGRLPSIGLCHLPASWEFKGDDQSETRTGSNSVVEEILGRFHEIQ